MARWGMPSSSKALMDATKRRAEKLQAKGKSVDFTELLRMEPDGGTTNIRNVKSKHWTRWLGLENRCVVPFNSFSEFNKAEGGEIWFALDESGPLVCFAGIWTNWTSVRKVKEGETTNDIFAFLTTEPNAEVGAVHPKAHYRSSRGASRKTPPCRRYYRMRGYSPCPNQIREGPIFYR
jgi:putative SOS response-associated peptidase YedK